MAIGGRNVPSFQNRDVLGQLYKVDNPYLSKAGTGYESAGRMYESLFQTQTALSSQFENHKYIVPIHSQLT